MQTFYFEVTDTFGGEPNYCRLNRFTIKAKTIRGAVIKLSRHTGLSYRNNGRYYKAKGACIIAYEIDCEVDSTWLDRAETL